MKGDAYVSIFLFRQHARQLVEEMINQPDGPGGAVGPAAGQMQEQLRVPRASVGVIIGKGGETIRDIQSETGARVQFVGECRRFWPKNFCGRFSTSNGTVCFLQIV